MPRIRLAHWHDGHAPGAEVDVADDDLPGLVLDGRVAEVLPDPVVADAPRRQRKAAETAEPTEPVE